MAGDETMTGAQVADVPRNDKEYYLIIFSLGFAIFSLIISLCD